MDRGKQFGIGCTLIVLSVAIFVWVDLMDPRGNVLIAAIAASLTLCPGCILLGRAIFSSGSNSSEKV